LRDKSRQRLLQRVLRVQRIQRESRVQSM